MKFLLVRKQDGGCDHTIGCGVAVHEIEAASLDEAFALCRESALSDDDVLGLAFDLEHGEGVRRAKLYVVGDAGALDLDLKAWAKEKRGLTMSVDEYERAEYERLKAKYGGDR